MTRSVTSSNCLCFWRPLHVRDADGNELLARIDGVVVHTTKRLGDRNMLNEEHYDRYWDVASKRADDLAVDMRDSLHRTQLGSSVSRGKLAHHVLETSGHIA